MNQNNKPARGILLVYTCFAALCSLIALVATLRSPSEPGSAVVLGLSLARLTLSVGLMGMFLLFSGLAIRAFREAAWAERTFEQWFGGGQFSRALAWFAVIGLGLGWIGTFLPSYRTRSLGPYWERVQPLMVVLLILSIATLAVFLFRRMDFPRRIKIHSVYVLSFILFLTAILVLAWMLYSKFGIYSAEDFWYGAGVPLLASQLVLAVLAGLFFLLIGWNWDAGHKDLLVAAILYIVTAVLWVREPLQKSFLFTSPRPPNNVLYPFADSAAFDAGSQFALIGQGIYIFNNPFTDRPLYLSHLVYLHSLFGQNYEQLMAAQAAIFAIFPVLIYLIGRSLNIRAVGFAAAVVAMFRGINSIAASSLIDLASPKMILSDFPAAIGVALVCLATCVWLKKTEQKPYYALWVGGAIAMTLMIRPHGLMFLVLIPLLALFQFRFQWKKWLIACLLIGLGFAAVTLPWELRTVSRGGIMYGSLVLKIQDVIRTRYHGPVDQTESLLPQITPLSRLSFQSTAIVASLAGNRNIVQVTSCNSILCFTPNHFLHNTITSLLLLPTSAVLDDLRHTVKEAHPYWRSDWDGTLDATSLFFLTINLFLTVLGFSVLWRYQRLPGVVPLAIFLFYNLSNSLARTSGGRYIVPVDWILTFYFMAGILFLVAGAARMTHLRSISIFSSDIQVGTTNSPGLAWRKAIPILITLFLAGSLIPVAEKLSPARYANFDIRETIQNYQSQLADAGLTVENLNTFLKSPGAEALVGRTLYPRSYKMGQGEISFYFYPYTIMDFPRTGFFLIGPHGQDNILLPGETPRYLPHTADTLVIGCREQDYLDALMVIVLDGSGAVYTRFPRPELACPMKLPVCQNNNSCQ